MAKNKKTKTAKKNVKETEKKVEEIATKKEEVFADDHSEEECPCDGHDHDHDRIDMILEDVSNTIFTAVKGLLDKYEDDFEDIDIVDMINYMLLSEATNVAYGYGMEYHQHMKNVGMASYPFLAKDEDDHDGPPEENEEAPRPEVKKPNLKLVN